MQEKEHGGDGVRARRTARASWRAMWMAACTALVTACGGGDGGSSTTSSSTPAANALSPMAQVGKQIFFDQTLSASGKQSCASCHDPARAFTDPNNLAVSIGGPNSDLPGLRNAPSLNYASFTPTFQTDNTGKT